MTDKKTIEKTKLIKLLSTFSSLEWKRFGRFVQSPYHNTNQAVIDLYTYLKKASPFLALKTLEQDRIYKKIYGKAPFKLNAFQSLCSDLYGLASDFVIDVHLQKENRKKDKVLIDALSERNYELFRGNSEQLIKQVETQNDFLDEDDFLLLHQLYDRLWHHLEKDTYTLQQEELHRSVQYSKEFYQTLQIQLNAEIDSVNNFINNKKTIIKQGEFQLLQLYRETIKLHNQTDTKQYFIIKSKIFESWEKLSQKHKMNLLVHLINFSFTNELINEEFGHQEPFGLYQLAIQEGLFIINGKMRDTEFINVSIIGFELKATKWTINFIKTHQQYLSKTNQKHIIPLCYAYEGIFSNNYNKVIELLINVHPSNNLAYHLRIKLLLLRAFFQGLIEEQAYEMLLKAEIANIQKLLRRSKKITPIKIEGYKNFLKIFKKMLFLFLNKTHSYTDLKYDLDNTRPLVLKTWLYEKMEEIKIPLS